jgi:hypothetical protein
MHEGMVMLLIPYSFSLVAGALATPGTGGRLALNL